MAVELIFVMSVVFILDRLPAPYRLTLLAVFVGSNQYLQTVLAATVYVDGPGGLLVSPGSVVLFSSSIVAVLLTYVREDVESTRALIYGVVAANMTLSVLALITDAQLAAGAQNLLTVPPQLFDLNVRVFLTGTGVLIVDCFLIIIVYEGMRARLPMLGPRTRVVTALWVTMAFDALAFSGLAFAGTPLFMDILQSQVLGKGMAGVAYGTGLVLWASATPMSAREIRDPFSIFTYSRQLEQERVATRDAIEASKAKSVFLTQMSHELRTPLNSVIGFSTMLAKQKHGPLKERQLLFIERINANGRHLLGLVNDLLDLSKVEAGKMEVHTEMVDVAGLIDDVVATVSGQVDPTGAVVLRTEVPVSIPLVSSDPGRLKQILVNLLGNALKFTDNGEVVVRCTVADSHVEIAVEDTGIGIPQDRLAAIFESFQQADSGTSRQYGGTGLGLAIGAAFCQLLGHELTVQSIEGKGSTFVVRILRGDRGPVRRTLPSH